MYILIKRFLFTLFFVLIFCFIFYKIFSPLYFSNEIIIDYGLHPFNICTEQPIIWKYCKMWFCITTIFTAFFISNMLHHFFNNLFANNLLKIKNDNIKNNKLNNKIENKFIHKFNNHLKNNVSIINSNNIKNEKYSFIFPPNKPLQLLIGETEENAEKIYLPEKSLYQNILITGTIGTGKTSSAMYPFTKQLISYSHNNENEKLGMLILDVKGNYYKKVLEFVEEFNRKDDVIIIELNGKFKYNPLDKPHLKASILAERLKTILLLFSKNNSESYWLDKSAQVLEECIKLCRLYNDNYVTFEELHKLVNEPNYYLEKINLLREKFLKNEFRENQVYDLLSSITFFEKEFLSLDNRTLSILKSEITRITNCFVSDYDVLKTFNPKKEELNFYGFEEVISKGKIVVLNMNINEYTNLSKIIAAYLKLDFQTEVMIRLSKYDSNNIRPVCFISDEYSEYCTETDANFFSQSREAKCINIVATQSYTSLLNTLHDESAVKVIIQNLINKLWFRNDDIFTIETAQKQIGKEDKEKISRGISENAKETVFSYFTNSLNSKNSSISETISTYIHSDFVFDTNFFSQELQNFTCLAFLSDGSKIIPPKKINLFPFFK